MKCPPSVGLLPHDIVGTLHSGLLRLVMTTSGASTRYGLMFAASIRTGLLLGDSYSKISFLAAGMRPNPTITQWTAACPRASLFHWNVRCAKWMRTPLDSSSGQSRPTCSPWVMELVDTKAQAIRGLAWM